MSFKLVTRYSPARWGIDIAEQPHYTVHTVAGKSMDTIMLAV